MIVVFGSLNVDMVLPVEAMPRPGDTILCPEYKMYSGGKGANQAVAAARAGSQVQMFGCLGQDPFAELCLDSLRNSGVGTDFIQTTARPTGCATICVDQGGQNMIMVASGANREALSKTVPQESLTQRTTVILQMEVPEKENWSLIERASKKKSRIILNLAPAQLIPEAVLRSLDILVMNQIEATVLALNLGFDVISPTISARRISARYGITCIVTLGSDGAFAINPQGGAWIVSALPITPVDTTGAGDAFVGVLAASLDQEMSLEIALRRAAVASGLACAVSGAQNSFPKTEDILNALPQLPLPRRII